MATVLLLAACLGCTAPASAPSDPAKSPPARMASKSPAGELQLELEATRSGDLWVLDWQIVPKELLEDVQVSIADSEQPGLWRRQAFLPGLFDVGQPVLGRVVLSGRAGDYVDLRVLGKIDDPDGLGGRTVVEAVRRVQWATPSATAQVLPVIADGDRVLITGATRPVVGR